MNPTSQDIATLLENYSSFSYALGTDLYFSRIPLSPQDCVTIMDSPGEPPMLQYVKTRSDYHYSGVTVYVRNTDYVTGYTEALSISEYLHGIAHTVVGGTYYVLIKATGEPMLLEYDKNDRAVIIVNFEVQRKTNA